MRYDILCEEDREKLSSVRSRCGKYLSREFADDGLYEQFWAPRDRMSKPRMAYDLHMLSTPEKGVRSLLSRTRDEEAKCAVLGFSSLEEADVVLAAMGY